jgi:exosortase
MQTLGMPAIAEGNVIQLNDAEIGIVEACSGLRMLMVFFALSTAVILVVRRPWWEKTAIMLSAVPIALFANLVRVTATGVLHEVASSEIANAFFHDAAGWMMMPLALALLWVELNVLSRLLIDTTPAGPVRLGLAGAAPQPRPRGTWKARSA